MRVIIPVSSDVWKSRNREMYLVVPHDACKDREAFFIDTTTLAIIPNFAPSVECDSLSSLLSRGHDAPDSITNRIRARYSELDSQRWLRVQEGL